MRKPFALAILFTMLALGVASAQEESLKPAPPRGNQGEGPFDRLILRGATLIDGTGAMPRGPVDIVIEKNRIVDSGGEEGVAIDITGATEGVVLLANEIRETRSPASRVGIRIAPEVRVVRSEDNRIEGVSVQLKDLRKK